MMFYFLIFAAVSFFITHVFLLLTSFPQSRMAKKRYFYSHLTLWLTGVAVFTLALVYSGSGKVSFLDYFDSPMRKAMILIFTAALSLVANAIVKYLVIPLMNKTTGY